MSRANELWHTKESPLWLLWASRTAAQYPTAENINNERVNEYVDQFAYGALPDLKDRHFLEKIHPGHKELFEILAKEALAYYRVFYDIHADLYDDYTAELVAQFDKAYGPKQTVNLKDFQIQENPQVVGNLIVAIAMAAIRDMALVEELHRKNTLSQEEYSFALQEINTRMSRVGINGIDRLFESKPELEYFIETDSRVIDVHHIIGELANIPITRAACYNNAKRRVTPYSWAKESITDLRQDVIASDFPPLEHEKNRYMLMRTTDTSEPNSQTREKFEGYGKMAGRGDEAEETKNSALLRKITKERNRRSSATFNEYYNFLIHDGIAINHPQRNIYAEKIRQEMQKGPTILSPGEIIDAVNITPASDSEIDLTFLPVASARHEPQIKPRVKKVPITIEAVNLKEQPSDALPVNKNASAEVELEPDESTEQEPKETQPHQTVDADKKEAVVDKKFDDENAEKSHQNDMKTDSNVGAKVAAIGGVAALTGLLLSVGHTKYKKEDEPLSRNQPQKDHAPVKPLLFVGAATVAIGGVVMWSQKPKALYKPLKELIDKLVGGIRGIQ